MFPIKDHNPSGKIPFVTYTLIAINVLVFIYMYFIAGTTEPELLEIYDEFALQPSEISSGDEKLTLITSMFMHGDIMHLGGNMLFLWIFGDNLEARMGRVAFIAFYLITGFAASGAQILSDSSSVIYNLGASGAIAGVMGGYLLLWPKAKIDVMITLPYLLRRMTVAAWIVLLGWFGLQLFQSYLSLGNDATGGVAYWAHAGGFVAGLILILPVWLITKGKTKPIFVKGHYRNRP